MMSTTEQTKSSNKWTACELSTLFGACAGAIMLTTDITSAGVALKSIGLALDASFASLQWVVNAYNLTFGAFLLTAGSLADLLGRKRIFTLGVILFNIAALMCGLAPNGLLLNCSRALQGIGAACVLPTASALIANQFQNHKRAKAYSFLGAAFGIGLAIGPLLSGTLTSWLSWRWIFWVNIPIGLIIVFVAVPKIAESKNPDAKTVDWSGLIAFITFLSLLIFSLINGQEIGWNSSLIQYYLIGALIFGALFIVAERRQRHPMFDLSLFRKQTFLAICILPFMFACGFASLLVYVPLYFQGVYDYSPLQAGFVMLPMTLPLFVVPLIVGQLQERIQERILLSMGLIVIGVGTLWLSRISNGRSWLVIIGGLLLIGIGAGIVNALADYIAVGVAPAQKSGMAAGIFSTMRIVGNSCAIATIGAFLITLIQQQLLERGVDGDRLNQLANRIARGDLSGAVESQMSIEAATNSYSQALSTVFLCISGILVFGALLEFTLVRKQDFN